MRLKSLPDYMREFCMKIVSSTIKDREGKNVVKKDLMQFLIRLRNNNETESDADEWKINSGSHGKSKFFM